MTFYADMQKIATDLLIEFKQGIIQYVSITPGNGPVHNPGPSIEGAPVTLVGAVARGAKYKYILKGQAIASDLQVTHSIQEDVNAKMDEIIIVDNVRYKIVHIEQKPASGTKVAETLIIRKGA